MVKNSKKGTLLLGYLILKMRILRASATSVIFTNSHGVAFKILVFRNKKVDFFPCVCVCARVRARACVCVSLQNLTYLAPMVCQLLDLQEFYLTAAAVG